MSDTLLFYALKMNLLVSVIILITLFASRLFVNRYTVRWRYVIWLFLSAALILPLYRLPDLSLLQISFAQVDEEIMASFTLSSAPGTGALQNHSDVPDSSHDSKVPDTLDYEDGVSQNSENPKAPSIRRQIFFSSNLEKLMRQFALIWFAGLMFFGLIRTASYLLSAKRLQRWAIPLRDPAVRDCYRKCCRRYQLEKYPALRINPMLQSPILAGFFTPCLYLPSTAYSMEELEFVFAHELTHYRHHDLWYKMFLLFVRTIYWFNPFLYVMGREAEKDIEYLCDSSVTRAVTSDQRLFYQKILLKTAASSRGLYCVTANLNDGISTFKERMLYMVRAQKLKRGVLPVSVLLVLFLSAELLIGCTVKPVSGDAKETHSLLGAVNRILSPENIDQGDTFFGLRIQEGVYRDTYFYGDAMYGLGIGQYYDLTVSAVTETSFDFRIQAVPVTFSDQEGGHLLQEGNPYDIIEPGRAYFNGDGASASYTGKDGTLSFLFPDGYGIYPDAPEIQITGLAALSDIHFVNTAIPGYHIDTVGRGLTESFARFLPSDGNYQNASDGDFCRIQIETLDPTGFSFRIYHSGEGLIFREHAAVFEDPNSPVAVYRGQEYTLYFDCSADGSISLYGFDEAANPDRRFFKTE